jgi:glutamyl-tRNA reductase
MDEANELVFDLLSRVEQRRQKELAIALRKMGALDEHQKEIVSNLTSKIVGELFEPVVENIRRVAAKNEPRVIEAATKLLEVTA